jgi:hypothetical protein
MKIFAKRPLFEVKHILFLRMVQLRWKHAADFLFLL